MAVWEAGQAAPAALAVVGGVAAAQRPPELLGARQGPSGSPAASQSLTGPP